MEIPEAAIDGFIDDLIEVERYLLTAPHLRAPFGNITLTKIKDSVARCDFPDIDTLQDMVARVCHALSERPQPLAPDEQVVHDAAWRLSDALNGGRRINYQPRPCRSDGTTD